jgi:NAD(P)-dependent dehydrogenase (short-subunit alcohol dehydrogenase family)
MNVPAKIALVTGGSRGLGKNTAIKLAEHGNDVILTFRSGKTEADAVVKQIESMGRRACALPLDVGLSATFAEFAEKIRGLLAKHWQRDRFNFLVNNAGIGINASFADTTEAQFDQLVNIHFKGVFFLTQKLLPLIADGGRIINMSSGLARFSIPGYSAYGAMKGAVEVLSRYMAKELGPRGIAVNVIAPGAIETDFGNGAIRDNKQLNAFIASQTARGRVGLPDDIGGVIASLLSAENSWINAQTIEASGGMFL